MCLMAAISSINKKRVPRITRVRRANIVSYAEYVTLPLLTIQHAIFNINVRNINFKQ